MKRAIQVITIILVLVILIAINGMKFETEYSIGIYTGNSPFNLSDKNIRNPVITAKDVIDINADFVADPFMVKENNKWYMFFEVMNSDNHQGDIGFATSKDGLSWNYEKIILDESFHLSYPQVFKYNNTYYMIPESQASNSIRLYKAKSFPDQWVLDKVLINKPYVDPSIVRYKDTWWMFSSRNGNLYLYYANKLNSTWIEHKKSPIVKNNKDISRQGGRIIILNNKAIRFTQDTFFTYGNKLSLFEIDILNRDNYEETEKGTVLSANGIGWSRKGMHQIDMHPNEGIACVDGMKTNIKIYGYEIKVVSITYDIIMKIINSFV